MHRRKKILYIITKSVWGGAQKYVFDLATNLPRERFEVAVAAGGDGLLFQQLREKGIKTISVKGLERDVSLCAECAVFFRLLKIYLGERPDIIHLSSSKIGGIGAVAAFLYKLLTLNPLRKVRTSFKPLTIFTVHGWGFKEDRALWQRMLIFLASLISTLFHNKVILINTADFQAARKFIPRRKLVLIRNGIAPMKFLSKDEVRSFFAKRIQKEIPLSVMLLGTIAELTKNKGIKYFIAALGKLQSNKNIPAFKAVVIGDGEDRTLIYNQIRTLGLEETVFLVGFIENAQQYVKGFDIFILPSLKEGLPYTILEAMAGECAIVATRVGGIPDLIKDRESGLLVPPKDPAVLAEAIHKLILDNSQRNTLSKQASETLQARFSFSRMIDQTILVYESKQ